MFERSWRFCYERIADNPLQLNVPAPKEIRNNMTTTNGPRLDWDVAQQKGSESTRHEDTLQRRDREDVIDVPDEPEGKCIHWPTLLSYVGPGFLVCIAYLDPGNLEADLQTGAYTGYQLLWVLLLAHIAGLVLQALAARLGVVTQTHLADVCRMQYDKTTTLLLWIMTELAIIGSDIQEVVGSAIGLQILFAIPLWAGCLLTALDTFTFLFIHVFGIRKLEGLFVFLVGVMTVSFFIDFSMSPPSMGDLTKGFEFEAKPYATVPALGMIGAVIMPHNIYLHSALVLSRAVDQNSPRKLREAIKYHTIDSAFALLLAFFINVAVVSTFARHFFDETCSTASTQSACLTGNSIDHSASSYGTCGEDGDGQCQEIGLSGAADALRGSLGSSAKYVWAVGLLAAGQSSTMTGTYAGQFVMEGFLRLRIPKWKRVLVTRIIALGPALAVTLLMGDNTNAMDTLSSWLNVLQSLQLPFAVIPLLSFCTSAHIMGSFTISTAMATFVWALSIAVICVNLFIVGDFLIDAAQSAGNIAGLVYAGAVIGACLYLGFVVFLMRQDLRYFGKRATLMLMSFRGGGNEDGVDAQFVTYSPLQGDGVNGTGGDASYLQHVEGGTGDESSRQG